MRTELLISTIINIIIAAIITIRAILMIIMIDDPVIHFPVVPFYAVCQLIDKMIMINATNDVHHMCDEDVSDNDHPGVFLMRGHLSLIEPLLPRTRCIQLLTSCPATSHHICKHVSSHKCLCLALPPY